MRRLRQFCAGWLRLPEIVRLGILLDLLIVTMTVAASEPQPTVLAVGCDGDRLAAVRLHAPRAGTITIVIPPGACVERRQRAGRVT